MIVWIKNPVRSFQSNTVYLNEDSDIMKSYYEPNFAATESLEEIRDILHYMVDHDLYIENDRGMIFDTDKIRTIIDLMESQIRNTGYTTCPINLLTRQHDLRPTVYKFLGELMGEYQ